MTLPPPFVERTKAILYDEWPQFEQALKLESPVSIRLNPNKPSNALQSLYAEEVTWASEAYYLTSRPVFTLDPLFHAGCYYVQEASSMFIEHLINKYVDQPVTALDLCAAPGGKATHLSSILPSGSTLVANETIRQRAGILVENIIKWGNPNTIVTNNEPAQLGGLSQQFDLIVCDMPCSGEGLFRKDHKAIAEWSVENVIFCAERQRRIASDIFPALKPGGLLIYSTCTFNREENESNVEWICNELGATLLETPRRFWPHKDKGEGFFIAAIRKKGERKKVKGEAERVKGERLRVLFNGMEELKNWRKDAVPPHSLAMSVEFPADEFPLWELDCDNALQYLRRNALRDIPPSIPKGFAVVTYKNHPLGFVKNVGNRANNLYPKEWKIRMQA